MAELKEINYQEHGQLKVKANAVINNASKNHLMQVRLQEVGSANANFPIFIIKHGHTGDWMLTALTSLQADTNLFVQEGQWTATYQPISMQTHPLYLMKSPNNEKSYTAGINPEADDFDTESGQPLFESEDKASIYMSRVSKLLENSIKQDIQTFEFMDKLEELQLLKNIELSVVYADNSAQNLKGLYTIDEDRLKTLTPELVKEFVDNGYLSIMYGMLHSIYQLNAIIRKNNENTELKPIQKINIEVSKTA
mgnify:CR=1 FL=1